MHPVIQTVGSMEIDRILHFRAGKEASCALLSMAIVVLGLNDSTVGYCVIIATSQYQHLTHSTTAFKSMNNSDCSQCCICVYTIA